jgi:hypothetical protein
MINGKSNRLWLLSLVLVVMAACTAAPAGPTAAPPPTLIIVTRPPQTEAVDDSTPTLAPTTDPTPIKITDAPARLDQHFIILTLHTGPGTLSKATVFWNVEGDTKITRKDVVIPLVKPGQPNVIDYSLPGDPLPPFKSTIVYHWEIAGANGSTDKTAPAKFKLTEATEDDERNDLPVGSGDQKFQSYFPDHAQFTLNLTPKAAILYAFFYVTQNNGIHVYKQEVPVPTQDAGKPLSLNIRWDARLGVQIPWQQFESWWVLIDSSGKQWRTTHVFNDYADKTFHSWIRTPTQYGVLYTYGQSSSTLKILAAALDHSIERLQAAFQYKLLYAPHVVVYSSNQDFLDWAPPQLAMEALGVADGEWGGAVVSMIISPQVTGYSVMQHELTHVFQYQSIESAQDFPRWWIEGSARYFEDYPIDPPLNNYEKTLRAILKTAKPPNLLMTVPDDSPGGEIQGAWQYYVGRSFVQFLNDKYGKDAFAMTYLEIAKQHDLWTALKIVTGKTSDQLNEEWAKWVSQ